MGKTCILCGGNFYARNLCSSCYGKEKHAGRIANFKPIEKDFNFWDHVKKTDSCWLWTGYKVEFGYGRIARIINGKFVRAKAHRFSYELHKGIIPKGMFVRHLCDVPACVNPEHLEIGDQKQNMMDCIEHRRTAKGERNGNAKISNIERIKIANDPRASRVIAAEYAIRHSTVLRIKKAHKTPPNSASALVANQLTACVEDDTFNLIDTA